MSEKDVFDELYHRAKAFDAALSLRLGANLKEYRKAKFRMSFAYGPYKRAKAKDLAERRRTYVAATRQFHDQVLPALKQIAAIAAEYSDSKWAEEFDSLTREAESAL